MAAPYGPSRVQPEPDEFGHIYDGNDPVPSRVLVHKNAARTPDVLSISARRRQVVRLRLEGLSNSEIAKELNVSTVTVGNDVTHIRRLYSKYTLDDWRSLLEGELMALQSDEQHLRHMLAFEEDVDRALRIYDRIQSTRRERMKALAIEEAVKAERGIPANQELTIKLAWDGTAETIDVESEEVEIIAGELESGLSED